MANISSWKEIHLKEALESEFRVPVAINNDSNCFTLGVKMFGEGQPYANMVGVTIGTGIGAGVIIDHRLYGGEFMGAGEIGTLPYLDSDFEQYCSSFFLNGTILLVLRLLKRQIVETGLHWKYGKNLEFIWVTL